MRCLRTIFPATFLWGASFPLALAAAARPDQDPARLSGSIYAANTAGAIAGALAFSLILIPVAGTKVSQQILIWLAALAGSAAIAAAGLKAQTIVSKTGGSIVAVLLLAWGFAATVQEMPWQAIAYGRRVAPILHGQDIAADAEAEPVFVGEGISSSVVITRRGDQRFFYVSGKSEASSAPLDMRLQRMMGHIPALFHRAPRSVLVVGFGAGVTAGSFVSYPGVESIVVCELEPLIPPASDQWFGGENRNVLKDPRTRLVIDDARHFVLTTPLKFDVITTDPIHPWVKGTSTLYSKDYYQQVKSHLNPGGVVAQWLPIYESDEETVKTELATFFSVFPDATVWSSTYQGEGYDLVLLGRQDSSPLDVDALEQRLAQPAYRDVAASLAQVEFHSGVELLATYAGRGPDLAPLLTGTAINDDGNMRLQYLAGFGLNYLQSPKIYADLLAHRRFPEDLLVGKGERLEALRVLIGRRHRVF
jgi:spermidine synthase